MDDTKNDTKMDETKNDTKKNPSVRDVLWMKKRARDQILDKVGKLCEDAWALYDKIAASGTPISVDAVAARELGARLCALGYIIEGGHYIDRIAYELRTKEVYLTAREITKAYAAEMVLTFLESILSYSEKLGREDEAVRAYIERLEQTLGEIRQVFLPPPQEEEEQPEERADEGNEPAADEAVQQ